MLGALTLMAINGYLAGVVMGDLFVESLPRHPHEAEQVKQICYAIPTEIQLQRDCNIKWEWLPKETDETDKAVGLPSAAILRQDSIFPDSSTIGSVLVINELRAEHQGRYVCRLSCRGRKTESATVILEIDDVYGRKVKSQNSSDLSYIWAGVAIALLLAPIVRYFCLYASGCWFSSKVARPRGSNIRNRPPQSEQLHNQHYWSVHTIRQKPKLEQRPTVLSNNVWLPPYDVALKHTRLVIEHTKTSTQETLPSYEEALHLMQQTTVRIV